MANTTLWIAEKPSIAQTFATALGLSEYKQPAKGAYISPDNTVVVTWLYGHLLRELMPEEYDPAMTKWTLETLPFIPGYWKKTPRESVKNHYYLVKELISAANRIVLATDFDREGEVIGRSLLDECNFKGKVERVNITSTDIKSIKKSIDNKFDGDIGLPLYYAGKGRTQADWLLGLNITRAITIVGRNTGLNGTLTAGRVQSAALNIIVEREKEIANFIPKKHYEVIVDVQHQDTLFKGKWVIPTAYLDDEKLFTDKQLADNKAILLTDKSFIVERSAARDSFLNPPLPYNLSQAQIDCFNKYGFSLEKTLSILQSLYDTHKLTTYPRTSIRYIPTAVLDDLDSIMHSICAMDTSIVDTVTSLDLSVRSEAWNDEKVEAHYALIPTTHQTDLSRLTDDEVLVYKLIRDSFIAQFMPPAKYRIVSLELVYENEKINSKGSTLISKGWMDYISPAKDANESDEEICSTVPELPLGTAVKVQSAHVLNKTTNPPKPFTVATLLAVMNNCANLVKDPELKKILKSTCGIGTEATRAGIVKTLFDRGYIVTKGKNIQATKLAYAVLSILPQEIKSVERTAYWEQQLESIAQRKLSLNDFMQEVITMLKDIFSSGFSEINTEGLIHKCPVCNKPLTRRKSAKGFFWGCSGYPECKTTFNDKKGKPDFNKENKKAKGK